MSGSWVCKQDQTQITLSKDTVPKLGYATFINHKTANMSIFVVTQIYSYNFKHRDREH